jgi:glycine oxidase
MRTGDGQGRRADAVVVGGGVIGLALARELARGGAGVVVCEAAGPGREATWAAGGMLAPQAEAARADDFFRLQCASRDAYPDFAAALREETGRDVELDRTGTLYLAFGAEDEAELGRRFRWQSAAGLAVERLTGEEARALEPLVSPRVRLALRFPQDWQVDNRKLAAALAESAEKFYGARVLSGVRVAGVRVRGGRVEGVETSAGFVAAGAVVLAAGAWTSRVPFLSAEGETLTAYAHPRVVPVRGQMLCLTRPAGGGADAGATDAAGTTPAPPRHVIYSPRGYVVPRRDGRLLAGSTTEEAGFDKSVTAAGLHAVLAHALEIAPALGAFAPADSWAGLRPRADDALPVIGESPEVERLFYATGHYRNGILLAPLTARIVSRMVIGGAPDRPDAPDVGQYRVESFSPARLLPAHARSTRQA